jgi:hypothetical protein
MKTKFLQVIENWKNTKYFSEIRKVIDTKNSIKPNEYLLIFSIVFELRINGKSDKISIVKTLQTFAQNDTSLNENGDIEKLNNKLEEINSEFTKILNEKISKFIDEFDKELFEEL